MLCQYITKSKIGLEIKQDGKVSIIIIAAVSGPEMVIGRDGGIPWHIPEEYKHFKDTTMDAAVIMGYNTWDSLPKKPLEGRANYVLTKPFKSIEGITTVVNLKNAIEIATLDGYEDIYIIGGAQVYKEAFNIADKLIISKIWDTYKGDTYFPIPWLEIYSAFVIEDFKVIEDPGFSIYTMTRRNIIG